MKELLFLSITFAMGVVQIHNLESWQCWPWLGMTPRLAFLKRITIYLFTLSRVFQWFSSLSFNSCSAVDLFLLFFMTCFCCAIRHSARPWNKCLGSKHKALRHPTFSQLPCVDVWFVEVGDPAGIKLLVRLLLPMWVTPRGQNSCKNKTRLLWCRDSKALDKMTSAVGLRGKVNTFKGINCEWKGQEEDKNGLNATWCSRIMANPLIWPTYCTYTAESAMEICISRLS